MCTFVSHESWGNLWRALFSNHVCPRAFSNWIQGSCATCYAKASSIFVKLSENFENSVWMVFLFIFWQSCFREFSGALISFFRGQRMIYYDPCTPLLRLEPWFWALLFGGARRTGMRMKGNKNEKERHKEGVGASHCGSTTKLGWGTAITLLCPPPANRAQDANGQQDHRHHPCKCLNMLLSLFK